MAGPVKSGDAERHAQRQQDAGEPVDHGLAIEVMPRVRVPNGIEHQGVGLAVRQYQFAGLG